MSEIEDMLADLSPVQQRALLARLDAAEVPDVIGRRGTPDAPLSYAQRGLWFLQHLRPEDVAYNICYTIDWLMPVDPAALHAAVCELTGRHEILRTIFPATDAEPRQVILPSLRVPLTEVTLAGDDDAGFAKWAQSAAVQPFDLERGPLLRTTLIRRGTRHTLVLAVHHIIFDTRSAEVLLDELVTLYEARVAGRAPGLAPLSLQFGDFAAWQRARIAGRALDADRNYWRARLAGAQALALPTDRQRGRALQSAGAAVPFVVAGELKANLAAVGRRHDATLFMVLLAGFVALLHRYTGRDDVIVGTSVTTRDRQETEGLIGYFLNTLVLRTELGPDLSFAGLVELAKATVLEAFEHKDLPFEQLVEELAPERTPGALPLVPVLFAYSQRSTRRQGAGQDAAAAPVARVMTGQGARADLTLAFSDDQDGLHGVIEYDAGLFDQDTIARMSGRLLTLLAAAAARPDTPVRRLPFLAGAEAAELSRWNATDGPVAAAGTLTAMVGEQARRLRDKIALGDETERLSYAELDHRSTLIARWLRGAGICHGQPVGVLLPRGVQQVVAFAGVLKAGGAYLPLDPGYPAERLRFMRADAAADVLISRSDLASAVTGKDGCRTLLLDQAWDVPAIVPERWAEPVHPDQPAYILYTSGSTGNPKGVVNTHRGLINRLDWMLRRFGAGPGDVILYKTPMSFDVSLWELVLPAMSGAEMVVARPEGHVDPGYLTDLIERHAVTMIHFVPSMLQAFLGTADPARCRSLRQVLCSGEELTPALRDRFYAAGFTAALDNLYGPTEAAIDVTHWRCPPGQSGEVPIGHPILNTQAYVLDSGGAELPVGVPGELWLGGDQLALGYLARPGLTADSFRPDPFRPERGQRLYRTGDLARRRPDGAIVYLGRRDQQVKLRGNRIELAEIEAALCEHECVSEAVVLLANPSGDARLVAYVVPRGREPANTELREHLARLLPAFMVPASYAFVAAIPLTSNGKADRNALRAITPEAVRATKYVEPRDDVEVAVAGLFAELTGVKKVGAHDDFFHIGGHSLLVLRLRARLVEASGIDLPLREIFEDPTVEGVAGKVVSHLMQSVDTAEDEPSAKRYG